jgi:hypothetical protein
LLGGNLGIDGLGVKLGSNYEDGGRGGTEKGLKDGCVSSIKDGPPLGVKLGIDKGPENGW